MAQVALPKHLLVKGSEVPRQCYSSTRRLDPESIGAPEFFGGFKPRKGGIYSSPMLAEGLSVWERFCFEEDFRTHRLTTRSFFSVTADAVLVRIDGPDDIDSFGEECWGRPFLGMRRGMENERHLYWQRVLTHADGIWMTQAGAEAAAGLEFRQRYIGLWDIETVFLKNPARDVTDLVFSAGPAAKWGAGIPTHSE